MFLLLFVLHHGAAHEPGFLFHGRKDVNWVFKNFNRSSSYGIRSFLLFNEVADCHFYWLRNTFDDWLLYYRGEMRHGHYSSNSGNTPNLSQNWIMRSKKTNTEIAKTISDNPFLMQDFCFQRFTAQAKAIHVSPSQNGTVINRKIAHLKNSFMLSMH